MAQTRYLARKTSAKWAAGTIGTPVAAASYPVIGPSLNLEQAEIIPGLPSVGTYMPHHNRPGGRPSGVSFSMEMIGQPSNTVPPAWGALLRACSFSEEVVSTNFFAYYGPPHTGATPTSGAAGPHLLADGIGSSDPIDITVNIDGVDQFCNDSLGSVAFHWVAGQNALMDFNFSGRVKTGTSQTASSLVAGAQTAYATEVKPDALRGCTGTIAGNTVVWHELHYDVAVMVDIRPDVNGEFAFSAPIITGYNPTWRVVFEMPLEATYNPQDAFLSQSSVALSLAHTAPAALKGHTAAFTGYWAALAQIGERNGKAVYEGTGTQDATAGPLIITTS